MKVASTGYRLGRLTCLALGLWIALALAGCSAGASQVTAPSSVSLGQPFQLPAGKTTALPSEKIRITFDRVKEDSRCPSGVQCVWAGQAVIVVALLPPVGGLVSKDLTLGPTPVTIDSFQIELRALDPSPTADGPVAPSAYVATLVVTRP